MRLPRTIRPPSLRHASGAEGTVGAVAVPGLGLSVDGWRAPVILLAPTVRTVALALPAFGLPAAPGDALDPGTSAVRLLTRLDEVGFGRGVLIGHSASCQIVAEVARRAPERVSALVLVGPATDPAAATWPRLAVRWLGNLAREPLGQVPLLARDYTYSGLVTFARAMDASRRHDLEAALAATSCPLLLVRGGGDRIAPQGWLDRLAARPGETRTAVVEAAAHMVPVTHPHELVGSLRPFLGEDAVPPLLRR